MRALVYLRLMAALVLTLLAVSGCATSSRAIGADRRNGYTLIAREISRAGIDSVRGHAQTVYDLIRLLRPAMLTEPVPRGWPAEPRLTLDAPTATQVYLDDVCVGDLNVLRSLPVATVVAVRRVTARGVMSRRGTELPIGAIMVMTAGGRRSER